MAAKISRYTVESCTKKTLSVVTAHLCELDVHNCSTHANTHLIANRHKQRKVILCFSDVRVGVAFTFTSGRTSSYNEKVINFQESFSKVRCHSTACTVWYTQSSWCNRTWRSHPHIMHSPYTLLQRCLVSNGCHGNSITDRWLLCPGHSLHN